MLLYEARFYHKTHKNTHSVVLFLSRCKNLMGDEKLKKIDDVYDRFLKAIPKIFPVSKTRLLLDINVPVNYVVFSFTDCSSCGLLKYIDTEFYFF